MNAKAAYRNTPFVNTLTRRDFLGRTLKAGGAIGLAALTQVPPFARRALAEGTIGLNGKKLLFIFLRGANDALNSCIPILDSSYNSTNRPNVFIPPQGGLDLFCFEIERLGLVLLHDAPLDFIHPVLAKHVFARGVGIP
jgi:hypothetical protein